MGVVVRMCATVFFGTEKNILEEKWHWKLILLLKKHVFQTILRKKMYKNSIF